MDVAVHGRTVLNVSVQFVEVYGQTACVTLELALRPALLAWVCNQLHVHEVRALQSLVDGPLLDLAVQTDGHQEFALVVVVHPLDLSHHVGVRVGHV